MGKETGITLIELLVVMALVAVLASIAMPGARAFVVKRATASAASAISTDFRFARAEALKRSSRVTICRSSNQTSCDSSAGSWSVGWIVFSDVNGNQAIDGNDAILRVQDQIPSVVSIQRCLVPSNTRWFFTFQGQGVAIASSDTWWITSSTSVIHGTLGVVISNQGRVSVKEFGSPIGCT